MPHGTYEFSRTEADAEAIGLLTKSELCAFFDARFKRGSPERRKLSTQVYSGRHTLGAPPPGVICLDNLEAQIAFKQSLFAFPVLCGEKPKVAPKE